MAAVATGEGVVPEGESSIRRGRFAGGAIQRVDTLDDASGAASGCPAHGDDAPSGEREARERNLVHLDPEGSVPLSVAFGPPDPDGDPERAAYLVPPASERALPRPGAR
jgi:hypothetical protein